MNFVGVSAANRLIACIGDFFCPYFIQENFDCTSPSDSKSWIEWVNFKGNREKTRGVLLFEWCTEYSGSKYLIINLYPNVT